MNRDDNDAVDWLMITVLFVLVASIWAVAIWFCAELIAAMT